MCLKEADELSCTKPSFWWSLSGAKRESHWLKRSRIFTCDLDLVYAINAFYNDVHTCTWIDGVLHLEGQGEHYLDIHVMVTWTDDWSSFSMKWVSTIIYIYLYYATHLVMSEPFRRLMKQSFSQEQRNLGTKSTAIVHISLLVRIVYILVKLENLNSVLLLKDSPILIGCIHKLGVSPWSGMYVTLHAL